MNRLKFAANLSFLFANETANLAERYALAGNFGFRWVECAFPYSVPAEELKEAKENAGVEQVLINTYPGDPSKGEFGFAAIPDRVPDFKKSLELSIKYAKMLECKKIHIMSGCVSERYTLADMEKTYISNLKYAADLLEKEGIMALIEPINTQSTIKDYFMSSPSQALGYIQEINHSNLRYQLDIFHEQILGGNLTVNIEKVWPYVGHIQIAQAPHRNEPFGPGEVDFSYIFTLFEKLNYSGKIGLEHKCTGEKTQESLVWLKEMGYEI